MHIFAEIVSRLIHLTQVTFLFRVFASCSSGWVPRQIAWLVVNCRTPKLRCCCAPGSIWSLAFSSNGAPAFRALARGGLRSEAYASSTVC